MHTFTTAAPRSLRELPAPLLVLAISLSLLVTVGYLEARRTFTALQIAKLTTEVELVQRALEQFLDGGLPLEQFVGFQPLTRPLLDSDPALKRLCVRDVNGRLVLRQDPQGGTIPDRVAAAELATQLVTEPDHYRLTLPLTSKFGSAGHIVAHMDRAAVEGPLRASFIGPLRWAIALWILFGLAFAAALYHLPQRARLVHNLAYTACLLLLAIELSTVMVRLYTAGIEAKTLALAQSLNARLGQVFALGLDLDDLSGLDQLFAECRQADPDIHLIRLDQGQAPAADLDDFIVFTEAVQGAPVAQHLSLQILLPKQVLYTKLFRAAKNFAILFLAVGLLARLLMALGHAPARKRVDWSALEPKQQLGIARALYALITLCEGLNIAFLPVYITAIADQHGNPNLVPILFSLFFVALGAGLLPAGALASRRGPGWLFVVGAALCAAAMLLLVCSSRLELVALSRILMGLGQSFATTSIQVLVLAHARQSGAAAMIGGFTVGSICGMAMGALFAHYLGIRPVFAIAALLALLCSLLAHKLLPNTAPESDPTEPQASRRELLCDRPFLTIALCMAFPTRLLATGVIAFALPLLLRTMAYEQDDIGQIMLFYPFGTIAATALLPRLVQAVGATKSLLLGAVAGPLALLLLSATPVSASATTTTLWLIFVTLLLGLAHGFVNSIAITKATALPTAVRVGTISAASVFRLIERLGAIGGPWLIGALLASSIRFAELRALALLALIFPALYLLGLLAKRRHMEDPS